MAGGPVAPVVCGNTFCMVQPENQQFTGAQRRKGPDARCMVCVEASKGDGKGRGHGPTGPPTRPEAERRRRKRKAPHDDQPYPQQQYGWHAPPEPHPQQQYGWHAPPEPWHALPPPMYQQPGYAPEDVLHMQELRDERQHKRQMELINAIRQPPRKKAKGAKLPPSGSSDSESSDT